MRVNGYYTISCSNCGGGRMISCTTVTSIVGNEGLMIWRTQVGAELQAKYSVFKKDEKPSKDQKAKLRAYYDEYQQAIFSRGHEKHSFIEAYFKTGQDMRPMFDDGYYTAFRAFLEEWEVKPLHIEIELHSCKDKIAGKTDLLADVRKKGSDGKWIRCVVDWKTKDMTDKGNEKPPLFNTTGLQLSAYGTWALEQGVVDKIEARMGVAFGSNGRFSVKEFPDSYDAFLAAYKLKTWAS